MTEKKPYILLVEDDPGVAVLAAGRLAGLGYGIKNAADAAEALAAIRESCPLLMLLDYTLPGENALEFVGKLKARDGSCPPFIIMTGHGGEEVAAEMIRAGARDYLLKGAAFLDTLVPAVKRVLAEIEAELKLEAAGRALRESEGRYRSLFERARDSILLLEPVPGGAPVIRDANSSALRLHGYSLAELLGKPITFLDAAVTEPEIRERTERARTASGIVFEAQHRRKDGSVFDLEVSVKGLEIGGKNFFLDISRDITEKKRERKELREALEMQEVLNGMMQRSLPASPLREKLGANLASLLAVPWLSAGPKGAVFLVSPGGNELVLTAQQGLPAGQQSLCARVPSGRCICGQAAKAGKHAAAGGAAPERLAACEGLELIDHYCAPIEAEGKILGVLNICLPKGGEFTGPQERFIRSAANVMAENIIRSQVEEQFSQSQKLEAIGLLAGGIAHDFNNILTAIKGYCALVSGSLIPEDPNREDMREIMNAAERATTLTRQLLAFGRRQILSPKVLDLNRTIGDMMKMLRRIIGEDVPLSTKLFPAPCFARIDPGQLEQVIVNLAVNARDAVSAGGEITLETELVVPPEEIFLPRPGQARGRYVCLKVRDTGCGMSEEVISRIYEPFFTTKEGGKGTGLGLSTVFGIVKQSGGEIRVESESGKGSAFFIYLPLAGPEQAEAGKEERREVPAKGTETVLVVEDEDSLRRLSERLLSAGGYKVLSAADGPAALKLMDERREPVDLLMADVVMPGMSGRELGLELARRKLAGRVLYTSGYTDEAIVKHGVLEPGIAFIYKPYAADALLQKIREVLDGPADQAKP